MVKPAAPCLERDHDHALRGPAFLGGGGGPCVLKRRDQSFVEALLAELGTEEGRGKMRKTLAADRDRQQRLRLWQPVHRVFHLAVLEASCLRVGGLRLERRIDPKRIVGSGLVIRRLVPPRDAKGKPVPLAKLSKEQLAQLPLQGWMRDADDRVMGWKQVPPDQDPDPEQRLPELRAGHPAVTARLAVRIPRAAQLAETVHPLFVAPPEKCEAAGSTLLYGVLPLTSAELTEDVPPPPVADDESVNQVVPEFLLPVPRGTTPAQAQEAEAVKDRAAKTQAWTIPVGANLKTPPADPAQRALFDARQQDLSLLHALGAFATEPAPGSAEDLALSDLDRQTTVAAKALRDHLDRIAVWDKAPPEWEEMPTFGEMEGWDPFVSETGVRYAEPVLGYGRTPWGPLPEWTGGPWPRPARRLGRVLREAAAVFRDTDAPGALAASHWRLPRAAPWHRDLRAHLKALLNVRMDEMTAGVGRYDRADALYVARAFVRLKRCDGCPPELTWSAPTQPFSIVPWYEPSGAPPVRVEMPEANLESLGKLKPNVAFRVPASLQSVMNGLQVKKPLDVSKGDAETQLAWLCGFNIPIITLCAFIVLSIFLSLLNILFWWLPLVKICIPIPRSSPSERL